MPAPGSWSLRSRVSQSLLAVVAFDVEPWAGGHDLAAGDLQVFPFLPEGRVDSRRLSRSAPAAGGVCRDAIGSGRGALRS